MSEQSISAGEAQAVALRGVNHLVGTTATAISKPVPGTNPVKVTGKLLVLHAESGNFRLRLGDHHTTLTSSAPGASVTDGSGSFKLAAGTRIVLPDPDVITAVGDGAGAILTYWWA